jgi:putative NADH-flavin reductase
MKLFVAGANGQVGRLVVQEALAKGHSMVAMARPSAKVTFPPAVELASRLIGREGALEKLAGCDAVLSCLGMKRANPKNPWSKILGEHDFNSSSAAVLIDAMQGYGVKRVIAISAAGVGDSAAQMNLVMKLLVGTSKIGVAYRDLARMEEAYAHSGLDWMCVRPTRLTDGPKTGQVQIVPAFSSGASISRADLAAWMVEQVTSKLPFMNRRPQITTTR